ncbi:MAG TPA: thioredoxin family protein, partial [Anaerolineales bacterium]|nr:thioredoxin family protein [Anaerolineales bacterium]
MELQQFFHMQPNEFFDKLKTNPRPVVVDLWAPWCMPCRAMAPLVKKMEKQYDGQVDVWKINADDSQDLLRALRVFGIPTMILYRD